MEQIQRSISRARYSYSRIRRLSRIRGDLLEEAASRAWRRTFRRASLNDGQQSVMGGYAVLVVQTSLGRAMILCGVENLVAVETPVRILSIRVDGARICRVHITGNRQAFQKDTRSCFHSSDV
jgi:hypothetical protein